MLLRYPEEITVYRMTVTIARARRLEGIGATVVRYGLALVIFWIGCLKFAAYEAEGVYLHASNSP